jgi:hypothetical protein
MMPTATVLCNGSDLYAQQRVLCSKNCYNNKSENLIQFY